MAKSRFQFAITILTPAQMLIGTSSEDVHFYFPGWVQRREAPRSELSGGFKQWL